MTKGSAFLLAALVLSSVPAWGVQAGELQRQVFELPWTGAGGRALELYKRTETTSLQDPNLWFKLGMVLYDARSYRTAMACFRRITAEHPGCCVLIRFSAHVWQGHIFDLLGRREEALKSYKRAASLEKTNKGLNMRHDQYKLILDGRWVKQRLFSPFVR